MSDDVPEAVVRTREQRRRRISLIWAIPAITVLVAAWLAWDTLSKRGAVIVIQFDSASSLQPSQSHVRYRDVDLGVVEKIALTRDRSHVLVTARMTREANGLLTDKARFWIVKPRFFAGAISGLETLVSGSYIQVEPSADGGLPTLRFVGLEDPPVLHASVPGREFQLRAARIGSMSPGSPVFFRDLEAGEVLGWDVGEMAKDVTIHVFVRAPYDRYVHDSTVFWNASGASVQLGASGLKVELESLRALVLGGIAFDTPARTADTPASTENRVFPLLADQQTAEAAMYDRSLHFVTYFKSAVSGLEVGAPVAIRGIPVGAVTVVRLRYDPADDGMVVMVRYDVEPGRIANLNLPVGGGLSDKMADLVHRGLRVRLDSVNIVTGSKQLTLDIVPNAPPADLTRQGEDYVLAPVEGDQGDIAGSAASLMARLQTIPFEQIGDNLNKALAGASGTINDPKLREALSNLDETLKSARALIDSANKGAEPLLRDMPKIAANLDDAVKHANQIVASLDNGANGGSEFGRGLNRLLLQLNDAARAIRILADLLSRHPEALIRGRTDQEVP